MDVGILYRKQVSILNMHLGIGYCTNKEGRFEFIQELPHQKKRFLSLLPATCENFHIVLSI